MVAASTLHGPGIDLSPGAHGPYSELVNTLKSSGCWMLLAIYLHALVRMQSQL